jgi:dipeptidyl aminopeptidase/acylaminoacyl peptidase
MFHRETPSPSFIERLRGNSPSVCLVFLSAFVGLGASTAQISDRRPITVEDCVRTRRVVSEEVNISADGRQVAYVVKSPDPKSNRNNYVLYVRSLRPAAQRDNGRKVLEADNISHIRWLNTGRLVARAEQSEGSRKSDRIIIIELATGRREAIECPPGTQDFGTSVDGRVMVFSTLNSGPAREAGSEQALTADQRLRGYEIPFRRDESFLPPAKSEIEVHRRTGSRLRISKLRFTGRVGLAGRFALPGVGALNLSPDGKYLLFGYSADQIPQGWEEQPVIKQLRTIHSPGAFSVLALCDVNSGEIRYAFDFSGSFITKTVWADDSKSYAVVSPSPFGSPEGNEEERAAAAFGNEYYYLYRFSHVFTVDVNTGQTTRLLTRDSGMPGASPFELDGPLGWKSSHGTLLVRTGANEFARMNFENGEWKEIGRVDFGQDGTFGSSFASDGATLVGVSQSSSVRPDLLLVNFASKRQTLLTDLNPEYQHIELGRIERIEWTNRFGSKCAGELIKPVGFESGKQYPLVLMGTSSGNQFVSDAPYTTAFAPQSLANAGFVVLLTKYPTDDGIPKGQYPGEIRDAYNWMAMMEAAIDILSEEGLIDKERVGIAGFSRTSWLTDFTLTHSNYHFRAASSADGGIYTYTAYTGVLATMGIMLSYEEEIGGPPYGETIHNWLEYTAPFNASHIHTPLLMEYTRIQSAFELFSLLNRQGKPVELYFYPNGRHPLDTPLQRVSSLQRNVDWFRFWIQGYERPNPEDSEQYPRWRALRALENRNE